MFTTDGKRLFDFGDDLLGGSSNFFSAFCRKMIYTLPAYVLCLAYIFSVGKRHLIPAQWTMPLLIAMAGFLIVAALLSGGGSHSRKKIKISVSKNLARALFAYTAIPVVLIAACWAVFLLTGWAGHGSVAEFSANIAVSTLTSFGGGEAYVSVADGIFVGGQYVDPQIFYQQIVPVANALPGPILVKIASAVGFAFAGEHESIGVAVLFATCAMSIAVGLCGIVSLLLFSGYEAIKTSKLIQNLNKYILPVICGMLASTSMSMSVEALKITSNAGFPAISSFLAFVIGVVMIYAIKKKYEKIPDILVLAVFACIGGLVLQ